jgi:tetratricopeptide (TPR) repeat protein
LAWQATFTRIAGRLAEAIQLLEQSLAVLARIAPTGLDTRPQSAFAFLQLGHCYERQVMLTAGEEHYQQARMQYQALEDRWGEATAHLGLGEIAYRAGNYAQARQHHEASLARFQALGDNRGRVIALERLGCILRDQGELVAAEPLIGEAVALYQAFGDRAKIARGQLLLGGLAMYAGDFHKAYPLIQKSVDLFEDLGLPGPRHSLGIIHLELGEYAAARLQLEAYIAQARRNNNQSALAFSLGILACLANVETRYAEAEQLATESLTICPQTNQIESGIIATAH